MSLINLIRIDEFSGAMLADEEFWRRGSRRTLSLDNLQPLLPVEFCESSGLEAVIGIIGDPSISYEAILRAQLKLKEVIKDPGKLDREDPIRTLKDIVDISIAEIENLIRKRLDDQLGFAYGFTADDLNRGYFESDGERIEIKLEQVRTDALKWIKNNGHPDKTKSLFELDAIIAGLDSRTGFHWYEWNATPGSTFLGTGLFESIGKGSDAASLAFIDFFRKRELKKRRLGMLPEEALFSLIAGLEAAARFNHEVGGYPQFVILDAKGKTHVERCREYGSHGAKLAQEIVTACIHDYIKKPDALRLIKDLIFNGKEFALVEDDFQKISNNTQSLEHFLRGYKNSVSMPKQEVES
jgi:hypothetical protein